MKAIERLALAVIAFPDPAQPIEVTVTELGVGQSRITPMTLAISNLEVSLEGRLGSA